MPHKGSGKRSRLDHEELPGDVQARPLFERIDARRAELKAKKGRNRTKADKKELEALKRLEQRVKERRNHLNASRKFI